MRPHPRTRWPVRLRRGRGTPAALLALTLALGTVPAAGQQQIAGRYMVSAGAGMAVLIDTATGRSWVYTPGSAGWQALEYVHADGGRQELPAPGPR